ncbi:hypothetical protein FQA47_019905 [Oryzias melastigma]|uniref:Uncharacterized protein n=1 Tax=Oryzias melastigma TaxID=30732 RepID=A0A834KYH3_ORYME|nr:hypothetical protein FQA47_019905 [Oryzias melastigma]
MTFVRLIIVLEPPTECSDLAVTSKVPKTVNAARAAFTVFGTFEVVRSPGQQPQKIKIKTRRLVTAAVVTRLGLSSSRRLSTRFSSRELSPQKKRPALRLIRAPLISHRNYFQRQPEHVEDEFMHHNGGGGDEFTSWN